MPTCWILDDQYGEKIYWEIRFLFPDWEYPVRKNIQTPLPFVDKIQNWAIILLDNYFPWWAWEEALGNDFLKELLEKNLKVKIICISDYGETLLEKYDHWKESYKKWVVIWFIPSKDWFEIWAYLNLLS